LQEGVDPSRRNRLHEQRGQVISTFPVAAVEQGPEADPAQAAVPRQRRPEVGCGVVAGVAVRVDVQAGGETGVGRRGAVQADDVLGSLTPEVAYQEGAGHLALGGVRLRNRGSGSVAAGVGLAAALRRGVRAVGVAADDEALLGPGSQIRGAVVPGRRGDGPAVDNLFVASDATHESSTGGESPRLAADGDAPFFPS
jgi:hypothetical protein